MSQHVVVNVTYDPPPNPSRTPWFVFDPKQGADIQMCYDISWADFHILIQLHYNCSPEVTISYIDEDNDSVEIGCQEELNEAFRHARHCGNFLHVTVRNWEEESHPTQSTPTDGTHPTKPTPIERAGIFDVLEAPESFVAMDTTESVVALAVTPVTVDSPKLSPASCMNARAPEISPPVSVDVTQHRKTMLDVIQPLITGSDSPSPHVGSESETGEHRMEMLHDAETGAMEVKHQSRRSKCKHTDPYGRCLKEHTRSRHKYPVTVEGRRKRHKRRSCDLEVEDMMDEMDENSEMESEMAALDERIVVINDLIDSEKSKHKSHRRDHTANHHGDNAEKQEDKIPFKLAGCKVTVGKSAGKLASRQVAITEGCDVTFNNMGMLEGQINELGEYISQLKGRNHRRHRLHAIKNSGDDVTGSVSGAAEQRGSRISDDEFMIKLVDSRQVVLVDDAGSQCDGTGTNCDDNGTQTPTPMVTPSDENSTQTSVTMGTVAPVDNTCTQTSVTMGTVAPVDDTCTQTFTPLPSDAATSTSDDRSTSELSVYSHDGIVCDHCEGNVTGARYKCGNCLDFDLCETCEGKDGIHNPNHVFMKLYRPCRDIGKMNGIRFPLLPRILYKDAATLSREEDEEVLKKAGVFVEAPTNPRWERFREKMLKMQAKLQRREEKWLAKQRKNEDKLKRRLEIQRDFPSKKEKLDIPQLRRQGKLDAKFVNDVTIPDGTVVQPGTRLMKTWTVQNAGTIDWSTETKLRMLWGNMMAVSAQVDVPHLTAGHCGQITVELIAPNDPGRYQSHWKMYDDGVHFGPRVWCTVFVEPKVVLEPSRSHFLHMVDMPSVTGDITDLPESDLCAAATLCVDALVAEADQAENKQQTRRPHVTAANLIDTIIATMQIAESDKTMGETKTVTALPAMAPTAHPAMAATAHPPADLTAHPPATAAVEAPLAVAALPDLTDHSAMDLTAHPATNPQSESPKQRMVSIIIEETASVPEDDQADLPLTDEDVRCHGDLPLTDADHCCYGDDVLTGPVTDRVEEYLSNAAAAVARLRLEEPEDYIDIEMEPVDNLISFEVLHLNKPHNAVKMSQTATPNNTPLDMSPPKTPQVHSPPPSVLELDVSSSSSQDSVDMLDDSDDHDDTDYEEARKMSDYAEKRIADIGISPVTFYNARSSSDDEDDDFDDDTSSSDGDFFIVPLPDCFNPSIPLTRSCSESESTQSCLENNDRRSIPLTRSCMETDRRGNSCVESIPLTRHARMIIENNNNRTAHDYYADIRSGNLPGPKITHVSVSVPVLDMSSLESCSSGLSSLESRGSGSVSIEVIGDTAQTSVLDLSLVPATSPVISVAERQGEPDLSDQQKSIVEETETGTKSPIYVNTEFHDAPEESHNAAAESHNATVESHNAAEDSHNATVESHSAAEDSHNASAASPPQQKSDASPPSPTEYANHLVATAMNVAARAAVQAYSTAKEVFSTLQAKPHEKERFTWKPSPSSWTPPKDDYTPPQSTWTPPPDTYKPPAETYKPPVDNYKPPASTWVPAVDTYTPPTSTWTPSTHTAPPASTHTAPPAANHATPPAPTQTCSPVDLLVEMGFSNRELNKELLVMYNNNLDKVIQELLTIMNNELAVNRH